LFGSRSEAAAFLVGAGIEVSRDSLDQAAAHGAAIKKMREELGKAIVESLRTGKSQPTRSRKGEAQMSELERAGNASGQVPLRLAGGAQPLVLVPTFVNESGPYDFILDTGAGLCLITPALASELGIAVARSRTGLGAAGAVDIGLGVADSVAVGRASASRIEVGITRELERVASVVGAPIHGALGFPFLRKFRLVLDYRTQTLELRENGEFSATPDAMETRVSFQLASAQKPLILLPVQLNGRGPYQLALDTGASTTVISSEMARELSVVGMPIPGVTGGGGSLLASAAKLDSIAIGNATAEDLAVVILDALKPLSEAVGKRIDGILGYNFLCDYTVTVDYPRELLTLRSRSNPA
jgi:predicted aspartyl protease